MRWLNSSAEYCQPLSQSHGPQPYLRAFKLNDPAPSGGPSSPLRSPGSMPTVPKAAPSSETSNGGDSPTASPSASHPNRITPSAAQRALPAAATATRLFCANCKQPFFLPPSNKFCWFHIDEFAFETGKHPAIDVPLCSRCAPIIEREWQKNQSLVIAVLLNRFYNAEPGDVFELREDGLHVRRKQHEGAP